MTSRDVRRGFLAIAATFAELEELLELREERPPLDDTVYRSLKNRWATNQILAWLAGTDCPA